jgi:hypothetical protein
VSALGYTVAYAPERQIHRFQPDIDERYRVSIPLDILHELDEVFRGKSRLKSEVLFRIRERWTRIGIMSESMGRRARVPLLP